MNMRDHTGPPAAPNRRRFVFQAATSADPLANAVVVSPRSSPGDPTAFGAVLAVYNAAGSSEILVVSLPAAGWTAYGTAPTPAGYRWRASSRDAAVTRVVVRANRIRIRGGGASWTYTLDETAQGRLAVWLQLGSAPPWCASAPAKSSGNPPSTAAYDRVDRFVGVRNTPPPPVCPPL